MSKEISSDIAIAEITQSLRRIFKAIQDYYQEVSNKFKITGPQLLALKTIHQIGRVSLGELSEKMYLHPSTITGVIDRLERKGYVSRIRIKEDRRVVKVQLTQKGNLLVKKAPNPVQGKMIFGLKNLERKKLNAIRESIQKLVEIMEAQNAKVHFFFDQK